MPAVVFQIAAAVLMLRRGLHRKYTAFFCYTAYNVCRSFALFALIRLVRIRTASYATYFYSYWCLDAISVAMCFLVLYCVFKAMLQNYPWLRRFASATFAISIILLLIAAICITALSPGTEPQHIIAVILLLERSLMLIEVGIVVLLFGFSAVAAIPWRTGLAFGIALGFGVNASIELAAASIRHQFGELGNDIYQFVCTTGYVLAVMIWLLYIRAPQESFEHSVAAPDATHVARWNETLTEILGR